MNEGPGPAFVPPENEETKGFLSGCDRRDGLLAAILNSITESAFLMDPDGTVLAVNRTVNERFGLAGTVDLVGTNIYDILPPDVKARRQEAVREVILSGKPVRFEDQRSGRDIQNSIYPVFGPGGTVRQLAVYGLDITARKQAERELQRQSSVFQSAIDNAHTLLVYLDTDFTFVMVNEAYARACQRGIKDLVGKNHFELYPDPENLRIFQKVRDTGEPVSFHDRPFLFPDQPGRGVTYWDWTLTPVKGISGAVEGLVLSLVETTGRKQAEDSLRESEARYRMLLNTLNEGVWVIDQDSVTTFVNPKMEAILGYGPGEMLGKSLFSFMDDEGKKVCATNVGRRKQGIKEQHDFEFLKKDGTRIYTSLEATPITGPGGEYLGAIAGVSDTTEEKKTLDALRETGRALSTQVSNLPGFVYRCENDRDWTMISVSAGCTDLTGYAPEDLTKNRVIAYNDLVHPDYKEPLREKWHKVIADRQVFEEEYPLITRNGDVRYVWERGRGVYADDGSLLFLEGFITDITHKKRMEEALRESEKKYRTLFQNMATGVFYQEADGSLVDINPAALQLFGISREEFLRRDSFHPGWKVFSESGEPLPPDQHTSMTALRTGQPVRNRINRIYNPQTDEYRWVVINAEPLFRPGGKSPFQVFVTMDDITELKRTEEVLRESEERFSNAFAYAAIGMALVSPGGRWIRVNTSLCEMLGYQEEELTSMTFQDQTHPDDLESDLEFVRRMLAGEIRTYQMEKRYFHRSGTVVWALLSVSLVRDPDGTPLYFISQVENITERKRAEENLKKSLEDKEVLLQEIHHRVKNNLASIISLIELQAGVGKNRSFAPELHDLKARVRSMALVHETLYRTSSLAEIDLQDYVTHLAEYLLHAVSADRGIRTRVDIHGITLPVETAIPCGLILTEIITNSIKYAFPPDAPCRSSSGEACTITVRVSREGDIVVMRVSDNGIGIVGIPDPGASQSLGVFLIDIIVRHQLQGTVHRKTTGGTCYEIRFPLNKRADPPV